MRKLVAAALFTWAALVPFSSFVSASDYPPPPNIRITYIPELNNEEQVFICPTDSNIIIANWRDFRLGYRQIGIGRSTDGGLTWTDSLLSVDMQYFGAEAWQSDPTMSVDRHGNYYMSALDWDAVGECDGSVISFYKSIDKGVSWTGPVPNVSEIVDPTIFEDKQFFTVDRTGGIYDGNIYCSWTRFPNPDRIMFVRSTDGCQSFEDTVVVGPTQTSTGCGSTVIDAGQLSIPIVTSNGDVHVFWVGNALDSGSVCYGVTTIKHSVSTDGGQTFSYEDTVLTVDGTGYAHGGINTLAQPAGDADISDGHFRGNLYIAFTNLGPEDTYHSDIDFVRSTDNGLTWSERYQINDPVDADLMDAFHPWLICNQDGILVVVFYDQRYDPPAYYLFDLIAAYSFDGGETFTTNHRISNVSSSPDYLASVVDAVEQPLFRYHRGRPEPVYTSVMAGVIGEYIGVTSFFDKISAVWTDSRDGNQEIYTATWDLPLLEPRLAYPEDNAQFEEDPTLTWSTAWKNYDDRYRVEVSPNPDFSDPVATALIDTNFYTHDPATYLEAYYWRVKAFSIYPGDSSEYSPARHYHVAPPECGDIDGDGDIDPTDAVYFVNWFWRGGPPPFWMGAADVDGYSDVNPYDIWYFVNWMWRGGPDLQCP